MESSDNEKLRESSPFADDLAIAGDKMLFHDAVGISTLTLHLVVEHVSLTIVALNEDFMLSACNCIRSLLESVARATWLLDIDIDYKTREARVYAVRFASLVEQLSLANFEKNNLKADEITARIEKLALKASSSGHVVERGATGVVRSIGVKIPRATTIIESQLKRGIAYKLLSGVAHGHHYAVSQIGFEAVSNEESRKEGLTLHRPKSLATFEPYLLLIAFQIVTRLIWTHSRYLGWDVLKLEEILEDLADSFHYAPDRRFWRSE